MAPLHTEDEQLELRINR